MGKNKTNAAIIRVSKKALLKLLDFEGGTIHSIRSDPGKWNPDEIEIVVEHPDLPEVEDGFCMLEIKSTYRRDIQFVNDVYYEKIERIDPLKKAILKKRDSIDGTS